MLLLQEVLLEQERLLLLGVLLIAALIPEATPFRDPNSGKLADFGAPM